VSSTHNGTNNADVIAFYDTQLDHMKGYEAGTNGRLNKVKKSLSQFIVPGMTVLDVGCGTGVTSRHLATIGADVVAIDIAPRLIEYAKSQSNGLHVEYLAGDVGDIDLDKRFDAIILADVFEHFIRTDAFQKMWRIFKHHTHNSSYVYLNMPSHEFSSFMRSHYPDKLQIVDEAWQIDDIVSLFDYWDFVPCSMQMYGIDAIGQYIEYLFIHRDALASKHQERMNQIYGGTNERKENPD